jgi:hypothetical protein
MAGPTSEPERALGARSGSQRGLTETMTDWRKQMRDLVDRAKTCESVGDLDGMNTLIDQAYDLAFAVMAIQALATLQTPPRDV